MRNRARSGWAIMLCVMLVAPGWISVAQDGDEGDATAVSELAEQGGAKGVNSEIFAAIERGNAEAVQAALTRSADPNATIGHQDHIHPDEFSNWPLR